MDHSDSLSDVPVEGAVGNSTNPLQPGLTEEEAEELRTELTKVGPRCSKLSRCLRGATDSDSCVLCGWSGGGPVQWFHSLQLPDVERVTYTDLKSAETSRIDYNIRWFQLHKGQDFSVYLCLYVL